MRSRSPEIADKEDPCRVMEAERITSNNKGSMSGNPRMVMRVKLFFVWLAMADTTVSIDEKPKTPATRINQYATFAEAILPMKRLKNKKPSTPKTIIMNALTIVLDIITDAGETSVYKYNFRPVVSS